MTNLTPIGVLLIYLLRISVYLLVLSVQLVVARNTKLVKGYSSVRCYSCMSKFYEANWFVLQQTYQRPMNFTDKCNYRGGHSDQKGVAMVDCPSVCVKMMEKAEIGGYHIEGYIRGCYDTMLVNGFNKTLVSWYRWLQRDSCHYYSRKEVLQMPRNSPAGHIYICTCFADGCNGSPRLSGASIENPLLRYWTEILAAIILGVLNSILTSR